MKKNHLIIACLIFSFGFVNSVKAETVLEEINRTGVVKFAMRNDSAPFGYLDGEGKLTGLCLDFFNLLKTRLVQKLNRQILTVRVSQSSIANRFSLVAKKQSQIECGPNTIRTTIPEGVAFSQPFFTTGIQFLVRPQIARGFDSQGSLANLKIGVLRNSTAQEFIKNKYPQAQILEYQGSSGRTLGIQGLRQDKIDAFATDGILILGETVKQGIGLYQRYELLPESPMTCDNYGMIIPNDPEWENLVNSVITEMIGSSNIPDQWFEILDTYVKKVRENCPE